MRIIAAVALSIGLAACGMNPPVALNYRGLRADVTMLRPDIAPPSADFTTYIEGGLIRVTIPSNWRELPGANSVTFAPEGAYGNAGVKSVFTHGLGMGLARNDKRDLRATTADFIDAFVPGDLEQRKTSRFTSARIGDRAGLHTIVSQLSETTGERERIEMFTTLLSDDTIFYVMAVAPNDCFSRYRATFGRVVGSIQFTNEPVKP